MKDNKLPLALRDDVSPWLESRGFVKDRNNWCIAWDCRSGFDYTDLEFFPRGDGEWDAIVGHHASGTNPRMLIGRCATLADVQMVYDTLRRINGYKAPEPERITRGEPSRGYPSHAHDCACEMCVQVRALRALPDGTDG